MILAEVITYNTIQFGILMQMILFIVFMWLGNIPDAIEGKGNKLHYMPFSGGLFIIFGGITFISLSFTLETYTHIYISGFLKVIGIIILIYGVLKAFYYPELPEI